jgi:hypothetical protein
MNVQFMALCTITASCYGMDLFATAKDLFGFVLHCYLDFDMVYPD